MRPNACALVHHVHCAHRPYGTLLASPPAHHSVSRHRGCLTRGATEARLAQNGGTMECCPKAVIGTLASQMGGQLLCGGGIKNVGVLPPLLFTTGGGGEGPVLVCDPPPPPSFER